MKLAVGYPVHHDPEAESFAGLVEDFRESVAEVYFAWPGQASGRSAMNASEERIEADLARLGALGVKLDLLLNANCYGERAVSRELADAVRSLIDRIGGASGLHAVTTASPFLAEVVKKHTPALDVRASVNMRLGTVHALDYLADLFDSFHMQREYNRDFERIAELKDWCNRHNKGLHLLANSGCLAFCSTQTFHDNMVAHEEAISAMENVPCDPLACSRYLSDEEHLVAVLQSTWIRPEDLHHYEAYFDQVKLATRMHQKPRVVLFAYARQRFRGNLLDLLEPGHAHAFQGRILDNTRFPEDWHQRVTSCARRCGGCGYCEEVLKDALTS